MSADPASGFAQKPSQNCGVLNGPARRAASTMPCDGNQWSVTAKT